MDICYAHILDNKIVLANNEASNLFVLENSEIINSNIYRYFDEKYSKSIHKKFRRIILNKETKKYIIVN